MIRNKLREKINEQQNVYEALRAGDAGQVCYREFQNGEWGTDDANYTNRLRLAYYLLYNRIDNERAVVYLFQEELKDRETNSFQGIGSTLRILTWLLGKYNGGHSYDHLLERAKNANFDCACGYDAGEPVEEDFENNDLLDCIYISQELDYKDVMGLLVDAWKKETEDTAGWNRSNRSTLIRFNTCLGRYMENENLYQQQLKETMEAGSGKVRDLISRYRDLIRCYLDMGDYGKAAGYCRTVLETTDYGQIRGIRLFGDILEECCEVVTHDPGGNLELWKRIKEELENKPRSGWYGNLYTKGIAAAKAAEDPYAERIGQEYRNWRKDFLC